MTLFTNPARGSDLGFLNVGLSHQLTTPATYSTESTAHRINSDVVVSLQRPDVDVSLSKTNTAQTSTELPSVAPIDEAGSSARSQCAESETGSSIPRRRLNRIAEVRKSQGVSERSLCKRLNIDLNQLRQLEDPTSDLTVSQLVAVQVALEVPLVDLLEDTNSLSRPVQERAKLVKVMKTAAAIKECKLTSRAMRLAEMLREQLVELMPELAEVSSWPQFGSRRGSSAIARILAEEINTSQLKFHD